MFPTLKWILLARHCVPLSASQFNCAQFRNNSAQLRSTFLRLFFNFLRILNLNLAIAIVAIDYCAISFNFPEFFCNFMHKSAELNISVLSAKKIEYFLYLYFKLYITKKSLFHLNKSFNVNQKKRFPF